MPAEKYCTDNFFTKMTDLESPKKNNDCYFYYYSTCSKGDTCGFRHEPSALGCETMCSFWKEGKCLNIHCNFRHMELRKNRKVIPCYWESQPGGCLKPHCPFMHQNARPLVGDESKLSKSENNALPENCTQAGNKSSSSVDSLVVNFEEESDTESAPATSPVKTGIPKVKTLEEIKLEKIAAACAAYYAYPGDNISEIEQPVPVVVPLGGDDLRRRILQRVKSKGSSSQTTMRRKLSPGQLAHILGDTSLSRTSDIDTIDTSPPYKKRKATDTEKTTCFKIKTLEEIRAERGSRQENINTFSTDVGTKKRKYCPVRLSHNIVESEVCKTSREEVEQAEVSSTSNDEPESPKPIIAEQALVNKPLRKLNLKKIKSLSGESEQMDMEQLTGPTDENMKESNIISCSSADVGSTSKIIEDDVLPVSSKAGCILERSASVKTIDESMLLLDDDGQDTNNITMKSEDDLLNEIDSLLED